MVFTACRVQKRAVPMNRYALQVPLADDHFRSEESGRFQIHVNEGRVQVDSHARRMLRLPRGSVRYVELLAAIDPADRIRVDEAFARAIEGTECNDRIRVAGRMLTLQGLRKGTRLTGTLRLSA